MESREIKINITQGPNGEVTTKMALDGKLTVKEALVGLELTKKEIINLFGDFCVNNKVPDAEVDEKYEETKIRELYQ